MSRVDKDENPPYNARGPNSLEIDMYNEINCKPPRNPDSMLSGYLLYD